MAPECRGILPPQPAPQKRARRSRNGLALSLHNYKSWKVLRSPQARMTKTFEASGSTIKGELGRSSLIAKTVEPNSFRNGRFIEVDSGARGGRPTIVVASAASAVADAASATIRRRAGELAIGCYWHRNRGAVGNGNPRRRPAFCLPLFPHSAFAPHRRRPTPSRAKFGWRRNGIDGRAPRCAIHRDS